MYTSCIHARSVGADSGWINQKAQRTEHARMDTS